MSSIAVRPVSTNRGVGKALVREFLDRARELQAVEVYLTTDAENNESTNAFYRRLGFQLKETFITPRGRPLNEFIFPLQERRGNGAKWRRPKTMKRVFDAVAAALGILLLSPLLVLAAAAVRLTSAGPVFFRQQRVGRRFEPFWIYKFRTMVEDAPQRGREITAGRDPRITAVGRFLRKTKIDEFPQLFNVLKGDMSLVGPRPEVPRYVEMFRNDYEVILQVRPGVTDLASLKYRDEAALLGRAEDPEEEYVQKILPEKILLAKQYVARSSLLFDLGIIFQTAWKLLGDRLFPRRAKELNHHDRNA